MKAIRVHEFGEPDVMVVEDVADPSVEAGTVLIDVKAIGVNPVDGYVRSGLYAFQPPLPYTPGMDGAGVVVEVGEGVTHVGVGDRVFVAGTITGAYAERCLCAGNQVFPLPDGVSFGQGAALGVPYGTAYRALYHRAQAQTGETVLIHGASGGVGIAAIQLAKGLGMKVVGTAGNASAVGQVLEQGADLALNHHDENHLAEAAAFVGGGIDVVLEMLANVNLGADLPRLAKGGRVVVIGSRGEVTINPRDIMMIDGAILGMALANVDETERAELYGAIVEGLASGVLNPVVGREYALEDAATAHRDVMDTKPFGKLVLVP